VRRGRGWVLDPGEDNLPQKNQKDNKTTQATFDGYVRDYEEQKEKTEIFVGKKYAGLGKWCDKQGLRYQKVKAFENALKYDPDNEDARKGLDFVKVDGKWRTKKQVEAMKEAKEGKLVNDSSSRYESALGLKLNKMESGHFRIETVFPVKTLKEYIKNVETSYSYFVKDIGLEPDADIFGGRKASFLVLGTKAQWDRYVDHFVAGGPRQREFTKKLKGSRNVVQLTAALYEGEKGDLKTTIDQLVHGTGHFMPYAQWGITQAWLGEGFAFYYTQKVLNTTRTHCTSLGDYNRAFSGEKDWGQSENWKPLLKAEVLKHADPDIRVFYGQRMGELQFNASVKSWSLITFLFDKHREKFMKWTEAVGREGRHPEEAMKEILGWTFEELDIAWREFVKENY
jgi:hypothetical protein